jgi:hypothetical protein
MMAGRWPPVLVRTGALLALAVLGWCAPAGARAGCGDYVVLELHPAPAASASQDTPAVVSRIEAAPVRHRVPCHGPLCSRGSLPPWNAVPPSQTPAEQWGEVGSSSLFGDQGGPASCCLPPASGPRRYCSSIYHPPRLLPSSAML